MTVKTPRKAASPPQTDAPPQSPQSTPPLVGGGGDYSPYVWTQLGDIQKALGRLESSVNKLSADLEKVESKIDKVEDKLSGVTHKVYAATVVLGILVAIGAFMVNKAWDIMAQSMIEKSTAAQVSPKSPDPK